MPSLFAKAEADHLRQGAAAGGADAAALTLDEFAGQQHFLGEGKLLRRLLAADRLCVGDLLWSAGNGQRRRSPDCLATESKRKFRQLSAVTSGVKELREVLEQARDGLAGGGQRTLLFIDEIHRFNKSPARRAAARCRGRHRHARRRDDQQPVLRRE